MMTQHGYEVADRINNILPTEHKLPFYMLNFAHEADEEMEKAAIFIATHKQVRGNKVLLSSHYNNSVVKDQLELSKVNASFSLNQAKSVQETNDTVRCSTSQIKMYIIQVGITTPPPDLTADIDSIMAMAQLWRQNRRQIDSFFSGELSCR